MLTQVSNQIADLVERIAPSVVQVQGHRRPASGVVYSQDVVLTTARAIGREEHPRIRGAGGEILEATLTGFDPATRLVVLRVPGLNGPALAPGADARVGQIAVAVARSWSNAVTATAGLVAVIGGPLATGPRREIPQVFRTSAPMHEGFAGGAFVGADGRLLGVATAASIRGLGVVIPASLAWATAADLLDRGTLKRGYLGIAAQTVRIPERQKLQAAQEEAVLVVGIKDGTPAAEAGLLLGDVLLSLDGRALSSSEDLFDLLSGERIGRPMALRILRGGSATELTVTAAERQ